MLKHQRGIFCSGQSVETTFMCYGQGPGSITGIATDSLSVIGFMAG